ncbi:MULTISPECIES: hypothetical protein [Rhizobium]|uniref:hypothetical protein n=1 Tax=Rhizobium TaxID=379 RepID=UPI0010300358|nr:MULTISPECIES: hypothetical protein [Rhizobium]MBY3492555.1 hypothetical protein [Rhizobium laguerreae]TBE57180.1 hypothetical protein ELH04_23445 [Rhizobium leguminosarum]TBY90219.1 hypothetical protein E0H40_15575 [Rhizobium leguminosarum bv. viciae]
MRLYAVMAGMLLASQANAQQVVRDESGIYHCQPTAKVGLEFNQQTHVWEPKVFNVDNTDFLLKLAATGRIEEQDDGFKSRVYHAGLKQFSDTETKKCWSREPRHYGTEEIILRGLVSDTVYCGADGADYQIDLRNRRYRVQGKGDFVSTPGVPDDPEYIGIGECEKVD